MAETGSKHAIENGEASLGIELGSTRIKATLVGPEFLPIANGSHAWENQLVDGIWTYSMNDVWAGLRDCIVDLRSDVTKRYGTDLTRIAAGGFSGMMHGYIALDKDDNLLVPFRTWRNNITADASEELTQLFDFPIPQRWSIAHLYQAIRNDEDHVASISKLTTLAGYVHYKLTGEFVLGPNEASGVFPVDENTLSFNETHIAQFNKLVKGRGLRWQLEDILPKVKPAGEQAGVLTADRLREVDPGSAVDTDVTLCPPEGDAGTGMIATNSVRQRTGNVSAGTSVFAMIVLEKALTRAHSEIDLIVTPDGSPVAMAHSNNCMSDTDAWVKLLGDAATALGGDASTEHLYGTLIGKALDADPDAGGLTAIPYVSGEHGTGFSEGRPLFVRNDNATFTLSNFIRSLLYSAICAMRIGLDVLFDREQVKIDEIRGHGGFFKTPGVGQRIMAAAAKSPCTVMETAGEGGSWGMALLAAFMLRSDKRVALPEFLDQVFSDTASSTLEPLVEDMDGFDRYLARYKAALPAERAAVEGLK